MLKLPVPVPHEARRNTAKHAGLLQDFDGLEVVRNPKEVKVADFRNPKTATTLKTVASLCKEK